MLGARPKPRPTSRSASGSGGSVCRDRAVASGSRLYHQDIALPVCLSVRDSQANAWHDESWRRQQLTDVNNTEVIARVRSAEKQLLTTMPGSSVVWDRQMDCFVGTDLCPLQYSCCDILHLDLDSSLTLGAQTHRASRADLPRARWATRGPRRSPSASKLECIFLVVDLVTFLTSLRSISLCTVFATTFCIASAINQCC